MFLPERDIVVCVIIRGGSVVADRAGHLVARDAVDLAAVEAREFFWQQHAAVVPWVSSQQERFTSTRNAVLAASHVQLDFGRAASCLSWVSIEDGLEAEREQGITIDVAYRYFIVKGRSFVVADTPGHEQYTSNMVTGASNSDLAILLVDARKGLGVQTCRHAHIVSLMGIRHVALAVNKIDLVEFSSAEFERTRDDFEKLVGPLGLLRSPRFRFRPVTATTFL